jgi:hypothetical protein
MRIAFLALVVLLVTSWRASGQDTISIKEDFEVKQLMRQFIEINSAQSYVTGWRVQVVSTTDRQRLESVRQSLKARYPYLSTSWVHNRPYYRLRAGAFATKLEALQLQHLLRDYYPGSIPTRDTQVSAAEIIGY